MKEWMARYPGDKVQVDIKYVPEECVRFPSYGDRYYQITAIDEYSRKRVLKIVKEKSTYETSKYLLELEKKTKPKSKPIASIKAYPNQGFCCRISCILRFISM